MTVGGAKNHRLGLDDGVLIKDNHIALAGGIKEAVGLAKQKVGHLHKIEVEITNWAQLREAVLAGADIIMIDNQTPDEAAKLVEMARGMNPNVLIEASGGMESRHGSLVCRSRRRFDQRREIDALGAGGRYQL